MVGQAADRSLSLSATQPAKAGRETVRGQCGSDGCGWELEDRIDTHNMKWTKVTKDAMKKSQIQ